MDAEKSQPIIIFFSIKSFQKKMFLNAYHVRTGHIFFYLLLCEVGSPNVSILGL